MAKRKRKQKAGKRRNGDRGLRELLRVLRKHPELANALVFDPEKVRRLLTSERCWRQFPTRRGRLRSRCACS